MKSTLFHKKVVSLHMGLKKSIFGVSFLLFLAAGRGQNASFTYSQPSKCVTSTVTFTNTSPVGYTDITWDWGDACDLNPPYKGTQNPTQHPFTCPGKYVVTLTLVYPSGTKVFKDTITVYALPNFSFRKLNDSICPNGSISFSTSLVYPASSAGVKSYAWDFGDGQSDAIANPTHKYTNSANQNTRYNVSLTITDTNGCQAIATQNSYVYVKRKPIANFNTDSILCFISGATSATAKFTNQTSGGLSYLWNFGDGGTDTAVNPLHTYSYRSPAYPVRQVATNVEGCTDTITKNVHPLAYKVNYTVSDTILCDIPHTTVSFRGLDFGSTYYWKYGDWDSDYSSISPVRHAYQQQGNYPVSIEATYMGCKAYDTVIIHAHSRHNPVHDERYKLSQRMDIFNRTICDPTLPVTFVNTTSYELFNDFGMGSVKWIFENDTIVTKGDTVVYRFSDTAVTPMSTRPCTRSIYQGDVWGTRYYTAIITTPYGCVLDRRWEDSITNDLGWEWLELPYDRICGLPPQWAWKTDSGISRNDPEHILLSDSIQIFRTHFCAMAGGMGCIPAKGYLRFPSMCDNFIRSAAPLEKVVVYWDFYGNPNDTTHLILKPGVSILNAGDSSFLNELDRIDGELVLSRIHTDTGVFQIAIVATNIEGCIDTAFIGTSVAGIPPGGILSFDFKEQCYNKYFEPATKFWVTFTDTMHPSNKWAIIDKYGDTAVYSDNPFKVSPRDTGYWVIEVVAWHHGCMGTGSKDTVFYTCPPKAFFDFPDIADTNYFPFGVKPGEKHPKFCGVPATVNFKDSSMGSQWCEWWFGDSLLLADQSRAIGSPTSFTYRRTPFIYENGGKIGGLTVTFAAHNADSVNIYSPTYNRCGYCADTTLQMIYISIADMNFVTPNGCTNDTITIYDSTLVNNCFMSWGFSLLGAVNTDSAFLDFPIGTEWAMEYPEPAKCGVFDNLKMLFTKPNIYRLAMYNGDALECVRYDTSEFSIFPQSIPQYVSGKDNSHFNYSRDTLCLNKPDTLYLRDSSYTASPFANVQVTQWQWVIFGDTFRMQNPQIPAKEEGLKPITLTITNDKNCTATRTDTVSIKEIRVEFTTPTNHYCNGETVSFKNYSTIYPYADNQGSKITCIWNWGDGTPPEIQIINSGQSSTPSISHQYNLPKSSSRAIAVTLTAMIDGMNCMDIYRDTLFIGALEAGFTSDGQYFPCPSNVGRTVAFSDTSKGNTVYYIWDFGDPSSGANNRTEGANERNPIHTYFKAGTYDVTLIIKDNVGCWDTLPLKKHIFVDGPWGDVRYYPLSGCTPLEVQFVPEVENTDTVIVNPNASLQIVLSKTDSTVSYTYENTGYYLPHFYLIKWVDNNGTLEQCILDWRGKDTIFAIDILPDFKTDSLYCIGVPVSFQDGSRILPFDYLRDSVFWDFGNGKTANSVLATTTYDSAGKYNVHLTVYARNCIKDTDLTVSVMPFPELAFHPDSAAACNNLAVIFTMDTLTDLENSRILRYDWSFSDGETLTCFPPLSRRFNLTNWYIYNVLLTFSPANCTKQYTDSIYIEAYIMPEADFEPTPSSVRMGEEILFADKSKQGDGNIISWQWRLGEDVHSQEQSPKHVYKTLSGYVNVYLVIEDANGCRDSIEHAVLITENLRFPNLFTPQSLRTDGKNYVFRPLADEGYFSEFKIEIYNKWGMSVWEQSCKEPNCPDYQNDAFWWNGKNRQGQYVSDGVYFWVVYAVPMSQSQTFILNGSVTVMNAQK